MNNSYGKGSGMPKNHKAKSTLGGSHSEKESSGVATGLSSREDANISSHGPSLNEKQNPATGNATERPKPYSSESVSEKGKSFDIC